MPCLTRHLVAAVASTRHVPAALDLTSAAAAVQSLAAAHHRSLQLLIAQLLPT